MQIQSNGHVLRIISEKCIFGSNNICPCGSYGYSLTPFGKKVFVNQRIIEDAYRKLEKLKSLMT